METVDNSDGTKEQHPIGEACELDWIICFKVLRYPDWGQFCTETSQPGSQPKAMYDTTRLHFANHRSGHKGPFENEDCIVALQKIIEVDECYEARDDSVVLRDVNKPRMTRSIENSCGSITMPQHLGQPSMKLFRHPTLPAKTVHVRTQYLVTQRNEVLTKSELQHATHAQLEMEHRKGKLEGTLSLPSSGEMRLTYADWLSTWKGELQASSPAKLHRQASRQVVGVAADAISASSSEFVAAVGVDAHGEAAEANAQAKLDKAALAALPDGSPPQSRAATECGGDDVLDDASLAQFNEGGII